MKFSELLGEPEPEEPPASAPDPEPISVFTPVPVAPPESRVPEAAAIEETPTIPPPTVPAPAPTAAPPGGSRSGLAELNVHQPVAAPVEDGSMVEQLTGLDEVVDDLLPSRRGRK